MHTTFFLQIISIKYSGDFRAHQGRIGLHFENKSLREEDISNLSVEIPVVEYMSVKQQNPVNTIAGVYI